MISATFKAWVNSGITSQSSENINPIRLTNIVAIFINCILLLKLFLVIYFWNESGGYEVYMTFLTVILLSFVPFLNTLKAHNIASTLLLLIYISNVSISCLIWEVNLNIQYFFLLAVFVCPFLFCKKERVLVIILLVGLCFLFVAIEMWFYFTTIYWPTSFEQKFFKLIYTYIFVFSCLFCSFYLWKIVDRSWQKLTAEKSRSEQLLLNILPLSITQRLKHSPNFIADYFEHVSILFADIQNFTPLCKRLSPRQLVGFLNDVFCEFDNITKSYGLEKIKTNGDGYMVAGGLPVITSTHAVQCCYCALDMQRVFKNVCEKHNLDTGLRIGIGYGEVIAGIIGKSKFSYDLWGEAVNLASRMESHGQCNKIQVTESIYEMAQRCFYFDKRGSIEVKGIGWINTYWLLGKKHNLGTHVLAKQC
jgi:adenylate cyclase